jgi:hypothetical protein
MLTFRLQLPNLLRLQLATYLILSLVTAAGCSAKRIVTVEQVNEIVGSHLHVGSSKEEVASFIDSLNIDSLRIIHWSFCGLEQLRWDNFDDEKKNALRDKLKEFYDAVVMDVAPSTSTFMSNIRMRFYFDEHGKLLDYTIKEDVDFR